MRYAYHLARRSGVKEWILDPRRLLDEMSYVQFVSWMEYEGYDVDRYLSDNRFATLCSLFANVHSKRNFSVDFFLDIFNPTRKEIRISEWDYEAAKRNWRSFKDGLRKSGTQSS